ncbi:class E sortase [Streptomyces sp. NPDC008121]|uniref:class E sortase n=1 Tax=Streptomyces sp. NPDC008121 TaxID=3364809 RepID=UPI0036E16F6D
MTPPPAPGPQRRPLTPAVAVLRVLADLFITVAVVAVLFLVYSLWFTNVTARQAAGDLTSQIRASWNQNSSRPTGFFAEQGGIGFLHIPALGSRREIPVIRGTDLDLLNRGVAGYYTGPVPAAMPWHASGNFSLAAHRDGHGARFHNLHKVTEGDSIVFESRDSWYIYRVFSTLQREDPSNVSVLQPVPGSSGRTAPGRYITLTTCTPVFTSDYRLIVFGELVRTEPVSPSRTPPAELR